MAARLGRHRPELLLERADALLRLFEHRCVFLGDLAKLLELARLLAFEPALLTLQVAGLTAVGARCGVATGITTRSAAHASTALYTARVNSELARKSGSPRQARRKVSTMRFMGVSAPCSGPM